MSTAMMEFLDRVMMFGFGTLIVCGLLMVTIVMYEVHRRR